MGFTTYDFYKDSYYGDSVDESSFSKWCDKASDKLDFLCGGNITEGELSKYNIQIQKATCAVMDLLFWLDFAEKNANNPVGGNVKSMSSGGQSVSFGENDTVITKVLSSKEAQNKLLREAISEYLHDTDILYSGV